jgi:hypothetical protein
MKKIKRRDKGPMKFPWGDLPPSNDYWEIKPELQGDKDAESLFLSVGKALTCWETIEVTLAVLFGILVECTTVAALRAYGMIASNRGRKDVLQYAAEAFFLLHNVNEEDQADFGFLISHIGTAAGVRNKIAHGLVTHYLHVQKGDFGYFLTPPGYHSKNIDLSNRLVSTGDDVASCTGAKYSLVSKQINEFSQKFEVLRHSINHHIKTLEGYIHPYHGLPDMEP